MKLITVSTALLLTCLIGGCSKKQEAGQQASGPFTTERSAGNGPFGLDLSIPFSKLEYNASQSTPDKGLYHLDSVPNPSPDFEGYAVIAYPEAGICQIRSFSKDFDGDSLGANVRAAADRIAEALEAKYGKPRKFDACGGGDVFCRGEFWSMAVMNGERTYGYEWKNSKKGAQVREINLVVQTDQLSTPFLRLDYDVNDPEKCKSASRSNDAKNL